MRQCAAIERVIAATAPLLAEYAQNEPTPPMPAIDDMFTIEPPPRRFIAARP